MSQIEVNKIICGDCLEVMKDWPDNTFDGIVTDPPYGLGFMGKEWDTFAPGYRVDNWAGYNNQPKTTQCMHAGKYDFSRNAEFQQWFTVWATECLRIAKPGAIMLIFGGDRTHHRLMCAIEDAGWEIRTSIFWIFGSGFPKSYNISKKLTNLLPANLRCSCAEHLTHRNEDSQSGCRPVDDLCDGQPLLGQDNDQDVSPSQGDVHEHNRVGLDADDLDKALKHTLGHSQIDHLSTEDCACLVEHLEADSQFLRNKLADILLSKLHVSSQVSHKKAFCNKDKSDSASDSVSSVPYSCSPNNSITRIYQKCSACQGFFCKKGFGTALKPAVEIIAVAMKPIERNFAYNMLKWGVAGLNIDGGRIKTEEKVSFGKTDQKAAGANCYGKYNLRIGGEQHPQGRWPANVILDEEAGAMLDEQVPETSKGYGVATKGKAQGKGSIFKQGGINPNRYDMGGLGASRFFYCAKASRAERNAGLDCDPQITDDGRKKKIDNAYLRGKTLRQNNHPTVKPLKLMEYLCRLLKPPTEHPILLDPFTGSGTTLMAAVNTGWDYVGIEKEADYCPIAEKRIAWAIKQRQGQQSLFERSE